MIIDDIIEAKKIWKEKYEKDYGKWGEFIFIESKGGKSEK